MRPGTVRDAYVTLLIVWYLTYVDATTLSLKIMQEYVDAIPLMA